MRKSKQQISEETELLEPILTKIMEQSPYLQRLCKEATEYDFGQDFIIFTYKNYKLKLELKIVSKKPKP